MLLFFGEIHRGVNQAQGKYRSHSKGVLFFVQVSSVFDCAFYIYKSLPSLKSKIMVLEIYIAHVLLIYSEVDLFLEKFRCTVADCTFTDSTQVQDVLPF